jgi:hypothetical protein
MYDVFFISYDEPDADINWQRLLKFAPSARRVHGVEGILQAHQTAAQQSTTSSFFVVDGDAWIHDDWDFTSEWFDDIYLPYPYNKNQVSDCVFVWSSINPYNGLKYGNGGLKLLPKNLTLAHSGSIDVTTGISPCMIPLDWVACENRFATSNWTAWRSAFRECAKLARGAVTVSGEKLDTWTTVANGSYGSAILAGAIAGKEYGNSNEPLELINDYNWLKGQYEKKFQ